MTEISPEILESTKLAADIMKQLITLSSAILALSVTFIKELCGISRPLGSFWAIKVSWLLYVICIIFAFLSLFAMAGTLAQASHYPDGIYGTNITFHALISAASFIFAMTCIAIFGFRNLPHLTQRHRDGEDSAGQ